jgi:ribonuclease-3
LGNALEALIGAIYLDQGYEMTKKFIQSKIVNPYINFNSIAKKEVNFKSLLIEWSQKYKVDITFDLIEEFTDQENQLVFQTRILVGGQPVGVGVGHSKKESQQKAAEMTMQRIRKDKELLNTIFASKNKESEKEALSDLDREICDEEIPSENA